MNNPSQQWEDIHRRLQHSRQMLQQSIELTPEARRKILKQRAQELARVEDKTGGGTPVEVVEFRLAKELYAVECSRIKEVYPLKSLTPIPGTPPFVSGIINLRGQIVSVIDLKIFFQLPSKGLGDLTRVIILKDDRMEFGLLAEEVMGTRTILREDIQPPLPTLTGPRADYLMGITGDRLIVLDAAKLLADEKLVVNREPEA